MLKLKLQYFGHLMGRTDSLERTLMLRMIEGGRRRGRQRIPCRKRRPSARPTISSSVIPFFCLQSFPASGSFPVSQFFPSGGQSIGVSALACQQIWKTHQWPQDWKRSIFIPIPKKGNAKECSYYCTIALISHASKVMLKILLSNLFKGGQLESGKSLGFKTATFKSKPTGLLVWPFNTTL